MRLTLPIGALLAALALPGCPRPAAPLAVTWSGCREVVEGSKCLVRPGDTLVFVAEGLEPGLTVEADPGRVRTSSVTSLQTEVRVRVTVRELVAQLDLRRDGRRFSLPLGLHRVAPEVEAARALKRSGEIEALRAKLAAARAKLSAADRARADGLLARADLAQGDFESAAQALEASAHAARGQGLITVAIDDSLAAAWIHTVKTRRFARARAALARAEGWSAQAPSRRAAILRSSAQVDLESFALGAARMGFQRALDWARRHQDARQAHSAEQMQAFVDVELGRDARAIEAFTRLLAEARAPCARANAAVNLGWAHLSAGQPDRAQEVLRMAIRLCRSGCRNATLLAYGHINLAIAALDEEDTLGAAEALRGARSAGGLDARMSLWAGEIEARAAAHRGQLRQARARWSALLTRADAVEAPDAAWRGRLGLARTWLTQSPTTAIAHLRAGEAELEAIVRGVPTSQGVSRFVARHAASARLLVEALLDSDDPAGAEAVAARALRRPLLLLRGLGRISKLEGAARDAWEAQIGRYRMLRAQVTDASVQAWNVPRSRLAQETARVAGLRQQMDEALNRALAQLPPMPALARAEPGPDEALVTAFTLDAHRLALFVRDARGVRAWRGPRAALPKRLEAISARRWAIDAAFPVPVPAEVDAVHVLRLGARREPSGRVALVVGDPTGDLVGARREAESVADRLRSVGFEVRTLFGTQATWGAVMSALPEVHHFHYAGHARFAGEDGYRSALPLADSPLELSDLFTLPAAPQTVVLSGCEAGRVGEAQAHTLGLAHAFLVAGGQTVLAPEGPVPDDVTRQLMTQLYAGVTSPDHLAPAISEVGRHPDAPTRGLARQFRVVERR